MSHARAPVGRPHGEIHRAMLDAWRTHGPAPTREVAMRAKVGIQAAHRTASRMVQAGDVVVLRGGKPAVIGLPEHLEAARSSRADAYFDDDTAAAVPVPRVIASFWELPMPP
jgi:hypothetical protein